MDVKRDSHYLETGEFGEESAKKDESWVWNVSKDCPCTTC